MGHVTVSPTPYKKKTVLIEEMISFQYKYASSHKKA